MMKQPILSIVIDKKGLNLSQGGTASIGPAHTIMFLPLSHDQIVRFFHCVAGIAQAKVVSQSITRDMVTVFEKITT